MSDVTSFAPADVGLWVSLDVHKLSIVVATLPPVGGKPDVPDRDDGARDPPLRGPVLGSVSPGAK